MSYTSIEYKAFEYIRNHKWKELKKILTNDVIDTNYRDKQKNYLLSYAVKFNKIDIVELLLEKNAKYDIIDVMGRSILFDAIQLNYIDIIKILLEFSDKEVGVSIADIIDNNGNIPLHYAIKYNNIDAVKLILKYNKKIYTADKNGFNSLHLSVKNGNLDIVKLIVENVDNINKKTINGETALHIAINYKYNDIVKYLLKNNANPNIIDDENEFTPLHYAVGWDNTEIIKELLNYNVDINSQDNYGNTPLMYAIKEKYKSTFDILIQQKNINLNLWNIDGKIVLHEILEKYEEDDIYYVDKLIGGSNISLQDKDGNTCLHYLVKNNLWKKYIKILEKKKMNIFSKNADNIAVIDLIYKEDDLKDNINNQDYNLFINTLTKSYLYLLKKEKKNWNKELDKICSRNFTELTEKEKKYINSNSNNIESRCIKLIKNKIEHNISKYFDNTLEFCQRSYPINIENCIEIKEGIPLDICTFTGSILDILMGLMFLMKKHKNACTTLSDKNEKNDSLCKFYNSMGIIMNGHCDFINFEIVWIEYKLYMLDNFSELFNKCIKSKARFIIIPLGIEMKNGSHANYIIYDKNNKELERFEPHGGTTPIGFNYNSTYLDNLLENYFKSIDADIKYIRPNEYIPKIGFQIMDSQEENKKKIGDPGGFCALWSIWYVDNRLTYHNYDRDKLIKILFENIQNKGMSYRNMIRNYSRNIIKQRDFFLKQIDIDVNDWLNDNYTYTQLDKFISIIRQELNRCCLTK
jgi:ankyrin repeat protein